jgi:hypothetical protein
MNELYFLKGILMIRLLAITAAALCAWFGSGAALAQGQQDFTLVNRTGYTINEVYVSPTRSNDWEEDVLDRDVLGDRQSVQIRFSKRENNCIYDLLIVFDDGETADWSRFDLCTVSRITLFYSRRTGQTTAEYE